MLKITTSLLIAVCILGCKKKKTETPIAPIENTTFGVVTVIAVNDTVNFLNTGNCYDFSVGLDADSLHTSTTSSAGYNIQSLDMNCIFGNNRKLILNAYNGNKLFSNTSNASSIKYSQGQTIDYTKVSTASTTTPNSSVSVRIVEEGVSSGFGINETFYLGTAFLKNGNFYNGWIKVKTLNNFTSCVLISYGVCTTANTQIKAE